MSAIYDHDTYDRTTESWTSLDPSPTYNGLASAAVGTRLYVMVPGAWDYNEATEAWTAHPAPVVDWWKVERAVGCRDRMVIVRFDDTRWFLAFDEYNIAGDSWTTKLSTRIWWEVGVYCHLMGKVYCSGGQGYSFRKHYEYNPNTATCTEKADPPYIVRTEAPVYPYGYIQISQVGDDFCAGTQGGVLISSPFYFSDYFMCVYDPKTDSWLSTARVWPEGFWYQGQFCDGGIS